MALFRRMSPRLSGLPFRELCVDRWRKKSSDIGCSAALVVARRGVSSELFSLGLRAFREEGVVLQAV